MIGSFNSAELANKFNWQHVGAAVEFNGVGIDSRLITPGQCFVAFSGERVEGSDFVDHAVAAGAVAILATKWVETAATQLLCDDAEQGLADMALVNRSRFKGKVVGITGSVGKTSAKEMLASILRVRGNVLATQGNFNNELGVPLTLLRLAEEHEFAVVEMGAAKRGDIAYLAQIAQVDVGIITNVRGVHLDGFGSLQGVLDTKSEMYQDLDASSCAVVNMDEAAASQWLATLGDRDVVTTSVEGNQADITVRDVELRDYSTFMTLVAPGGDIPVQLAVPGMHMVRNAVLAAGAATILGLNLEEIKQGLEDFSAASGRLNFVKAYNGADVIDDTYNANPTSMIAAIDVLANLPGNKILVMGEMGELGCEAKRLHCEVAEHACRAGVQRLLTVGGYAGACAAAFGENATAFEDHKSLIRVLLSEISNDSVVLVKGSRFMAMEQVVVALLDHDDSPEAATC